MKICGHTNFFQRLSEYNTNSLYFAWDLINIIYFTSELNEIVTYNDDILASKPIEDWFYCNFIIKSKLQATLVYGRH